MTGVQTCALPILNIEHKSFHSRLSHGEHACSAEQQLVNIEHKSFYSTLSHGEHACSAEQQLENVEHKSFHSTLSHGEHACSAEQKLLQVLITLICHYVNITQLLLFGDLNNNKSFVVAIAWFTLLLLTLALALTL